MDEDGFSPDKKLRRETAQLERLRDRLAQKYWDFSGSYNSFDGFSEGVCLLGGLDPTCSQIAAGQYGASFLPGGLKAYWQDRPYPAWEHSWQLQDSVHEGLSRYVALGLKGRVAVETAILAADKAGLILDAGKAGFSVPWLEAANGDLECAKNVPPKLRTNDQVREKIRHEHSVKAGGSRAAKAPKTRFLNDYVQPIFDRMFEAGFSKELRAKSSGRPIARRISDAIYFKIEKDEHAQLALATEEYVLPELDTFRSSVIRWLRTKQKNGEQKKE